jgi:hypothetical protein
MAENRVIHTHRKHSSYIGTSYVAIFRVFSGLQSKNREKHRNIGVQRVRTKKRQTIQKTNNTLNKENTYVFYVYILYPLQVGALSYIDTTYVWPM